ILYKEETDAAAAVSYDTTKIVKLTLKFCVVVEKTAMVFFFDPRDETGSKLPSHVLLVVLGITQSLVLYRTSHAAVKS
ncbi:hypothetical protein SK128_027201, partial [Halocaridina rubra]